MHKKPYPPVCNLTVIANQNGPEEREKIEFSYIEDENLASETTFFWDGTAYKLDNRKHYYYSGGLSASPEPVKLDLPLVVSPHPTTGMIRLSLTEPTLFQVFNAQGGVGDQRREFESRYCQREWRRHRAEALLRVYGRDGGAFR